jgi:hypothetical protein
MRVARLLIITLTLLVCVAATPLVLAETRSLAGVWRFQLDRNDCGAQERWFERSLDQHIHLSGALQNEGFGDDITADTPWTGNVRIDHWKSAPQYDKYRQPGHVKVPFFLQPEKHYVGPAWYQRELDIPASWQGKRIVLTLERPHWQTRLWVDNRLVGSNDSLGTPHVYDLGVNLCSGKHTLTIRVDNRLLIGVGEMAHSVTDHSQGNWNGIIGKIEIAETDPVWIDDLQAYPDVTGKLVKIKGRIGNRTGQSGNGVIHWKLEGARLHLAGSSRVSWDVAEGAFETIVPLGPDAPLWDEFQPAVFRFSATLGDTSQMIPFGLRQIGTEGRGFVLNGKPVFFRGTLECCVFPLTGYPPTDTDSWRRIIKICKSYGLNHMRFHSWCPPEAAFAAADEAGFYFQVECCVFGRVGDGAPLDDWIYRESRRIVEAYGNHPSFVLFTHGNEPHGAHRETYLARWVDYWKQRDSRRLVTSGTAFPILAESQYHVFHGARGAADWFGRDYGTNFSTLTAPVILHEMGQWCSYPDFDDIKRFDGALKPHNFEIFRDSLEEHGMLNQWRDFMRASGELQVICYKEEIESALQTPGIGGFQLLDLHDFPGQGTALVGVLDALWKSKGYVSPGQFRRFCGATVPLARLPKRVWTTAETLTAVVEAAHFGPHPLTNACVSWDLRAEDNTIVASGKFPPQTLPLGQDNALGKIQADLKGLAAPAKYKLTARLTAEAQNDWNIWVYPSAEEARVPADVLLTSTFDDAARTRLDQGGKVLLTPASLSWDHPKLAFQPVFWNRYMFSVHPLQTLGLLIDSGNPALAAFPTGSFQDWQWNDVVTHARGVVLDGLPSGLRPIVQVIDDWNTNRRLGLIFECRAGSGRLLVCAADLATDLDHRPAAAQLRRSLLSYAASSAFNPTLQVPVSQLTSVFSPVKVTKLVQLGAKIIATDSEDSAHGHGTAEVLDGNGDTFWQARSGDQMPHYLVIDLGREVVLRGLTFLPRQDRNAGRPAEVQVFCGDNPKQWGAVAAAGKFKSSDQPQTVDFPHPATARYVKMVIQSATSSPAALAELDVVTGN